MELTLYIVDWTVYDVVNSVESKIARIIIKILYLIVFSLIATNAMFSLFGKYS